MQKPENDLKKSKGVEKFSAKNVAFSSLNVSTLGLRLQFSVPRRQIWVPLPFKMHAFRYSLLI